MIYGIRINEHEHEQMADNVTEFLSMNVSRSALCSMKVIKIIYINSWPPSQ
jgi:hypothetical protein